MTEKIRSRFPAPALLLCAVLATLPGCAVIDLLASGASDGTKYVIRKVEESNQGRPAGAAGTTPAIEGPAAGAGAPAGQPTRLTPAQPPNQTQTPAQTPVTSAAPVIPVTRGEPLD